MVAERCERKTGEGQISRSERDAGGAGVGLGGLGVTGGGPVERGGGSARQRAARARRVTPCFQVRGKNESPPPSNGVMR